MILSYCIHTVPPFHPRDIGSTRLNGTAVRVSWRPLSRSEARGFITNYIITYWRVGSNAANASTITVSGEDASSAIIINLNSNSDYYFTVSAGTVQGLGNVSVLPWLYPDSLYPHKYSHQGINVCTCKDIIMPACIQPSAYK